MQTTSPQDPTATLTPPAPFSLSRAPATLIVLESRYRYFALREAARQGTLRNASTLQRLWLRARVAWHTSDALVLGRRVPVVGALVWLVADHDVIDAVSVAGSALGGLVGALLYGGFRTLFDVKYGWTQRRLRRWEQRYLPDAIVPFADAAAALPPEARHDVAARWLASARELHERVGGDEAMQRERESDGPSPLQWKAQALHELGKQLEQQRQAPSTLMLELADLRMNLAKDAAGLREAERHWREMRADLGRPIPADRGSAGGAGASIAVPRGSGTLSPISGERE